MLGLEELRSQIKESLHCQARNENTEMVYELSRTFKEARIEVIRLALIALDFLFR